MRREELGQKIVEMIRRSVIYLPSDVKLALSKAYQRETSELGRLQLKNILDNIEVAERERIPVCQDTGVPIFFVKLGHRAKFPPDFNLILKEAVEEACLKVPLRPNVVSPINRKNTNTDTGLGFPWIHYEVVSGDEIEITFLPKGGGSENMSALAMLNPIEGIEGAKRFVMEKVKEFGGKPCPPYILGIGLGGSSDISIYLAKKATLRPVGVKHRDSVVAGLEEELYRRINRTGIGPMGLGGENTVLAVNIELAGVHVAVNCVALNCLCWAARRAVLKIKGA